MASKIAFGLVFIPSTAAIAALGASWAAFWTAPVVDCKAVLALLVTFSAVAAVKSGAFWAVSRTVPAAETAVSVTFSDASWADQTAEAATSVAFTDAFEEASWTAPATDDAVSVTFSDVF